MVGIKNKKGLSSIMLGFFIFIIFFLILYLGVQAYAITKIQTAFSSIDFNIGDTSFNETYNNTMDLALQTIVDRSDPSGMILIFGMIIVMLLIGYSFSANRLWIVFDLFVIVVSFIISVYMSRFFNTFINSSPELLDLYSTTMEKSSTFILNLPFVVIIVGGLVMIITYAVTRKKEEISGEFR